MKRSIQFIIFIFVILVATSGFCQIRPGAFSVSPFFGGFWFDGDEDLDHRPVYGLRLGYDFTKHWGAEAVLDYVNTKYKPTQDRTTDVFNYRLEGLYHFMPDSKVVPFVAVGVGGMSINYAGNFENKTRAAFDIGPGVKYFITDWLALRADVRYVLTTGSIYNNLEYALGFTFYFGGTKATPPPRAKEPEPAPPPPTPPPVKEPEPALPLPPPVEEMKKVPEVEQKILEKGRVTLNVEFDFNKAVVKPKYYKDIQSVAEVMKKYPDLKIVIEGHTDNVGGEKYNLNLSQKRAEAIKNIMVTKYNVEPSRLTAKGFGYSKPIASNSTKEGRQKNRRVEAAVEYTVEK
jgi:OOP family OmpA-OmpF porin